MRPLNKESLNKIKQWEGLRLEAYRDQAGVWTIGYGHTRGVKPGQKITAAQATKFLLEDLRFAQSAVDNLVKVPLTDNQYGALVSFVFNVGAGAFGKSTLLKRLNEGNYAAVPMELVKWNKITVGGKKVTNRGLVNRRAAEIGLWAKGGDMAPSAVEVATSEPPAIKDPEVMGPVAGSVGVAGTGVTEVVNEAASQMSFMAMYSKYIQVAFLCLIGLGLGLTIYSVIKKKRG